MNQGPQHIFESILSSDSGRYYCLVQSVLRTTSEFIDITVKYGPKHISVLSSPSGGIKEGSSVTLSCSSDANPAAEYTWFKNNQPLLWGPSQPHTFHSVRPEDRGTYRCHAENKYGHLSSNSIIMDVQSQREPIEEQDGHHCAIIHTSLSENQDEDQTEMGGTAE
ncbi:unnamed protein product [Gadus morhua 'NCC']